MQTDGDFHNDRTPHRRAGQGVLAARLQECGEPLQPQDGYLGKLNRRGKFENLLAEMKSHSGRYNQLWYTLLSKAEEAKVDLSAKTSTEIDPGTVNVEDDDGNVIDTIVTMTRSDFEAVIKNMVESSIEMVRNVAVRNRTICTST